MIEVVTFAGTLTHAGEYRVTTVRLGDVVDQFHDENRLANASAAEQADLAALGVRSQKVNDLDAGNKDLAFSRLLDVRRCVPVDGALLAVTIGPVSSTGSPMTFMMRPSVSRPTGTSIGAPVSATT